MDHLLECAISGAAGAPATLLDQLGDDDLERFTIDLKQHLDAGNAWLLRAVEELDRRRIPERTHILTTRQWLKRFCQMTGAAASTTVMCARSLVHMPDVAKRAEVGSVPSGNLTQIAQARRRHPEEFEIHEPVFADVATYLDAREMRRVIGHWEQQVDHADAVRRCTDRVQRRRMSLHQSIDGMWHHDGQYDPESGHIVAAALHSRVDPANLDPDDRRTHGQRMVDGLADICRFWLDHHGGTETSGGEKPHITITVDWRQLADIPNAEVTNQRLPEIDGTPVTPETIRRLACDAGIIPMVLGTAGDVLDVGRKRRTVTPAIRRALDRRDEGCRWDGCDHPASWCDAHHITHWADGGATSVGNMILLCRRHHSAIHDGTNRIAAPPERPPP